MNRFARVGIGLTALWFGACADNSTPSGGGSITPSETFSGLYVAAGSDSIARIDLGGRVVSEMKVGAEPTRIARSGSRVYVTLRNERAVAVLEDSGKELTQVGKISTGAEPYGIVATKDRVYVAASTGGSVLEYDSNTFQQLRSWNIAGEPRWLTMHPSQTSLYVGSAYGGVLTHINLTQGVARQIPLPAVSNFSFIDGSPVELSRRLTSDIVVSQDGSTLYVGGLYVDNHTVIADVKEGEEDPCNPTDPATGGPDEGFGSAPPMGGDPRGMGGCGGGYDGQKFNPVVDKIPVEPVTGDVDGARVPEAISIISGATIEDSFGNPINFESIAGYPSALALSEDGKLLIAAIDGAEAVVVLNMEQDLSNGAQPPMAGVPRSATDAALPGGGGSFGFSFRPSVSVKLGAAPRGIAIVGNKAYVHAWFDQKLEDFELDNVKDIFDFQNGNPGKAIELDVNQNGVPKQLRAKNALRISSEVVDHEVDAGRRLFFATNNPLMVRVGASVSCGTCHFEGRTDGLTWTFERGLRQTPNLAVNLAETLPVGWAGNVATVADEGFNTSQKLMGGQELTREHAGQIQKFLFAAREIDTPNKMNVASAQVIRGQALFANLACNSCHNGASYTDNKTYTMLGLEIVKTRPLAGIAASAPYFHDGSAQTLREVVRRAGNGEMGNAFPALTIDDEDALVEYLKSL